MPSRTGSCLHRERQAAISAYRSDKEGSEAKEAGGSTPLKHQTGNELSAEGGENLLASPLATTTEAHGSNCVSEIDLLTMLEDHHDVSNGQFGCYGPCLIHQITPGSPPDDQRCIARADRRLGTPVSQKDENRGF